MIIVPSNVGKVAAVELVSSAYIAGTSTSTAFPTHQPGDLLVILSGGYGGYAPTAPAAGGNVPTYNNNYYRAYSYNSAVSWAVATSSSHTTGAWGDFTYAAVFRNAISPYLISKYNYGIGYNANGNSTAPNAVTFTPTNSSGTSMFAHIVSGYSNGGYANGTFNTYFADMLDFNNGVAHPGIIRAAIVKSKTDPFCGFGTCTSAYYYNVAGVEIVGPT